MESATGSDPLGRTWGSCFPIALTTDTPAAAGPKSIVIVVIAAAARGPFAEGASDWESGAPRYSRRGDNYGNCAPL